MRLVYAQIIKSLANIQIVFADCDNAGTRRSPTRHHDAVDRIGPQKGQHGITLIVLKPFFHRQNTIAWTDIEPAPRHREITWLTDRHPINRAIDDGGRFNRIFHAFQSHPCPGITAHRKSVETVIEHLLHAGRIQDRHHHIDKMEFRLVGCCRTFGGVVIPHQGQHATPFRSAGHIGMAEHVP